MGIRKKCLIITLLCFSSLMHASEFMFKHLEVKDGLSNNQVLDIFKDSEGFMWFATASGLNRYDGCQMTLFRSNNADPASLPDNYIKSIQEDYKGNLWILTGVGYVIYNSESETFDREVHAWLCEVGIDGTPALVYIGGVSENNMLDTSKVGTYTVTYTYLAHPALKAVLTIRIVERFNFLAQC